MEKIFVLLYVFQWCDRVTFAESESQALRVSVIKKFFES